MMTEVFANDLFGLFWVFYQCVCVSLLCVAMAKSVPGYSGVSFLLALFHDLLTTLDHKLFSIIAHPVL